MHSGLRKVSLCKIISVAKHSFSEYIIIAASALADSFGGLALLLIAVQRIGVIMLGYRNDMVCSYCHILECLNLGIPLVLYVPNAGNNADFLWFYNIGTHDHMR